MIRESVGSFQLPYKNDIAYAEKEIAKAKKKKNYPENVYISEYKAKFYVGFKEGNDGIYQPEAYSTKPDNFDVYYQTTLSGCILRKHEKGMNMELPVPQVRFNPMYIKLSYSEKQLKKIAGYVNKIPREERNCVGVCRYKDGVFLPVDLIVNGKSLNELAGKKEF